MPKLQTRSVRGPENVAKVGFTSQNNDSVAKDNKEEAGVSRHTKNNNDNKMELRGAIEELGNDVCCCGNNGQAGSHTVATKVITDCVRMEHNGDMRKSVNDGVEVDFEESGARKECDYTQNEEAQEGSGSKK